MSIQKRYQRKNIDYKQRFTDKATKVHTNKYDYSIVVYRNVDTKVEIICPTHGVFEQTPRNHAHKKSGCNKCAVDRSKLTNTKTTKQFITDARRIHGEKYSYEEAEYKNVHTPVKIKCLIHGIFKQAPNVHTFHKAGCPTCAIRLSQEEFIIRAINLHNNKYDYSLATYETGKSMIEIICMKHGLFKQKAESHLQGIGCPTCGRSPYSGVAIRWLNKIAHDEQIFIQHAENIGEYIVPGTKLRVDGICKETNTIYEFYGDIFHGNPKQFDPEEFCCPFKPTNTANDLYCKTMRREQKLRKLGFNLVTIWESDFRSSFNSISSKEMVS